MSLKLAKVSGGVIIQLIGVPAVGAQNECCNVLFALSLAEVFGDGRPPQDSLHRLRILAEFCQRMIRRVGQFLQWWAKFPQAMRVVVEAGFARDIRGHQRGDF